MKKVHGLNEVDRRSMTIFSTCRGHLVTQEVLFISNHELGGIITGPRYTWVLTNLFSKFDGPKLGPHPICQLHVL